MLLRIASLTFFAVFLSFFAAGCGSSEPLGRISGTVTYNGQPVEEGIVSFHNAETGRAGQAELQSGGTYEIDTAKGGLEPGQYQVSILPPTETTTDSETGETTHKTKEVSNIPDKYRSGRTSGLSARVEEGSNEFDFSLEG
ncbi:MAG: carboxypeptidase regulatory-like domain-containing protein [Rhodopirellula sp.]|nr:carboxypeptidase regulatory-like domain-containing protein [Rhodopirellula sp.]